jgi:predicted nucleic acid-binding protein
MTTAVDTNVIVALWDRDPEVNSAARAALDAALAAGRALVAAPVFAELMAAGGRDELFMDSFIQTTGLIVDWNLDEKVWRVAGRAFRAHARKRRRQTGPAPRRILADFLIGAHALGNGYRLLTFDRGIYRSAFPGLEVIEL